MIIQKVFWHIYAILKLTFYKLIYGKRLSFSPTLTFRSSFHLSIGTGYVKINNNVFFNNNCSINCEDSIIIGEGTIFGEGVRIYDHNHSYQDIIKSIKAQGYKHAPIKIGKHCWIASNVVILKGVTIGDNVTIGAGCIIHKDIHSNTVVMNKQNLIFKDLK